MEREEAKVHMMGNGETLKSLAVWLPIFGLLYLGETGLVKLQGGGNLWWLTPIVVLYAGLVAMIVYRIITKPRKNER